MSSEADDVRARWQMSIGNDRSETPAEPAPIAASKRRDPLADAKTVLLLDSESHSRDERAKMLRALSATVHCVATTAAARLRFESGTYNLVLIDLGIEIDEAENFAAEIRARKPRQLVAFLVGSPMFLAKSLKKKNRLPEVVGGTAISA